MLLISIKGWINWCEKSVAYTTEILQIFTNKTNSQ